MDRKTLKQAPIYVRDAYNHAIRLAPSDLDGAIRTLVKVVREYPEVAATREKLREFELAKARGMNPLLLAFWLMRRAAGSLCGQSADPARHGRRRGGL